jgi:mono/diheme cytochrome c family protein
MKSNPETAFGPWRSARVCLLPAVVCLLTVAGCRQDMHNQPKYRPLRATTFFADGASARPLVEGTVARGTLQEDQAFFTGRSGNTLVTELPFAVDEQVLARGQERYNIFCSPCHDATGSGRGMVVQRGFRPPASFHEERLRNAEAGHFFDVMTNGFGAMPDYRQQLTARDRWTVVAYIRALQLSQHADRADVPGGDPAALPPAGPPPPGH